MASESNVKNQAARVAETVMRLPADFRKEWDLYPGLKSEEIEARVSDEFDDRPETRCDALVAFIGKRLGYSRFSRRSRLTSRPLWDLLDEEIFKTLDKHDRKVLQLVADTTPKHAYALYPRAALAALALWMHDDDANKAEANLLARGVPTESAWAYSVVVELFAHDVRDKTHHLSNFCRLLMASERYDAAALIAAMALVAKLDPWRAGSIRPNLINACDIASQERPFENRFFIDCIADAAVAGRLRSSWIENPIRASIRMAIDSPEREQTLRDYYGTRPCELSPGRLAMMHEDDLTKLRKGPVDAHYALGRLLSEVEAAQVGNPVRAIHLLELILERQHQLTMIGLAAAPPAFDPIIETLVRLYLQSFQVDPHAVKLVRAYRNEPSISDIPDVQFENYFIICDYDHSFGDRTVSVLGANVSHLDKDTAAKIKYFQTGRSNPNTITKWLASFRGGETWLLSKIMDAEPVSNSVEFVFEEFLELVTGFDFTTQVARDLKLDHGTDGSVFESIAKLPIKRVERAIGPQKTKRLIWSALGGAASGGAGPITLGLTTVVDTPLVLYLAAETCARYCWYYGFHPAENEDIIAMILGVTLQGSKIQSVRLEHVRKDLRRFVVRRSIALGAIGNGSALQLLAPTFGEFFFPARGVFRRRSETTRIMEFGLPAFCAATTIAINASFVYDLCEAARWVLTDRFFARKYPGEWESRF